MQSLCSDFNDFLEIMKNHNLDYDEEIDINNCRFLPPTLMLPLISLSENYGKKIGEHNDKRLNDYKNSVLGYIENKETTLPMERIKNDTSEIITTRLYDLLNKPEWGENIFKFISFELLQNVYDHSDYDDGFVLAQTYHNAGWIDICFMDNGNGITGSYEKVGYTFKNNCYDILEAINGHSSKTASFNDYPRGTGLNNTINLIINGIGGEVLIASGIGLIDIHKNFLSMKNIPKNYIKGTMISIRLRLNVKDKINLYDYLKKADFHSNGDNMEVKEIILKNEIDTDLGARNKIEDLFNVLAKSNAKKVIMNFENVEFISRSAAQEYLNQKNRAKFIVKEKHAPEQVKKMMEFIIESNKIEK